MMPAAATAAGRKLTTKESGARQRARRPAAGRGAQGAHQPAVPRRVSGPVSRPRPRASAVPASRPVAPRSGRPRAHLAATLVALPDHPLLDRLIRGRAWIPLLGAMLAGIVAMQVEALKLGASIGRSLQRSSTLQSRNDQLREEVASLAEDQRIERLAARMGMIMPAPDSVTFLAAGSGANVQAALGNIHPPNPSAFLSLSSANGAVAGVAGGSSTGSAGGASAGGTAGAGTAGGPSAGLTAGGAPGGGAALAGAAASRP